MSACISALTEVWDRDVILMLFIMSCVFPLEDEPGPDAEIDWLELTSALAEVECDDMDFVTISVITLFCTFVFDSFFALNMSNKPIFIVYRGCNLFVLYCILYTWFLYLI